AYCVRADAEMEIAAAVIVGLEIAGAFEGEPGLCRRCKIGGPAEQPRQARGDRVQHVSRRIAAGYPLGIGGKDWDVSVPALGEVAPLHPLALIGQLGVRAPVALAL